MKHVKGFFLKAAIIMSLLGVIACRTQPPTDVRSFDELVATFLETRFELSPTTAIAAGRHEYDGLLPDLSPAGFDRAVSFYERSRTDFMNVDPNLLSTEQRFERELLLYAINRYLYRVTRQRSPFKSIAYYRGTLSPDTYVDREYAPKAVRLVALERWATNVPTAIAQVQANLEVPMPASYVELAVGYFRGMSDFLRDDVPIVFADVEDQGAQKRLGESLVDAIAAFDEAGAWAESLRNTATQDFALGAQAFSEMLLETELIDLPLSEIKRLGEEDLATNVGRAKQACASIGPNLSLADCVQVASSHKAAGGAVVRGQQQLVELKQFLMSNDLVSIPSDEEALVAAAPPHRRSNLAYIRRPGPFDRSGLASIYYIAPPDPAWTPEQQAAYVPGEAQLLFISAHEVWPGHFLQGLHTRQHARDSSRLIRSYANSEGWAHYVEQMLWEQGLRDDPVSEIGHLMGLLTRNVRYLSAVGLHTEGMSVEQSQALFIEKAMTAEGRAIRQAARGTYDPQYLKYTLGKILIIRMRDRWLAERGADRLKEFHDRFLSYGAAPLPLIEKYMFPQTQSVAN